MEGGGYMKICLSVFNLNDTNESSNDGSSSGKKRLRERFNNSGVKKLW